eukprot:TRINITY_DN59236_c0_g1_i1.p1 TRINITY_DN59236_c0_g1~~TRINITY_DN59236_c0_g1_i1.p1  ORF type:complete len:127 (-),score=8.21 TRINITY_DN59236_c0_g1_i1:63-443(-)
MYPGDVWESKRQIAQEVKRESLRKQRDAEEQRRVEMARVKERRQRLRTRHHRVMDDNRELQARSGSRPRSDQRGYYSRSDSDSEVQSYYSTMPPPQPRPHHREVAHPSAPRKAYAEKNKECECIVQ